MKPSYPLALLLIAIFNLHSIYAQEKFWGMTSAGGKDDLGVIFSTDQEGNNYTAEASFEYENRGIAPTYIFQASNGKYYGSATQGGDDNKGVLFEYEQQTKKYTVVHAFGDGSEGYMPAGRLFQALNGKIYGVTQMGGANDKGTLFEFDVTSHTIVTKMDLDTLTTGAIPAVEINGKFYGTTPQGGDNDLGTLFTFDNVTNTFEIKVHFDRPMNGAIPINDLLQGSNGKLYGVTSEGGDLEEGSNGPGVLYEFDPVTEKLAVKHKFDAESSSPSGGLVEVTPGKFYGVTLLGGSGPSFAGRIYEYDLNLEKFTAKADFGPASKSGWYPYGKLLMAKNGNLFGFTRLGVTTYSGTFFEYDRTSGSIITRNDYPQVSSVGLGVVIAAEGEKLTGVVGTDGANNHGTLFEYDLSTTAMTSVLSFSYALHGATPHGSLMQASNGKLYGMTRWGGKYNEGVIFEFDPQSKNFITKHHFNSPTGSMPWGSLMQAVNGKLYGMTREGGEDGKGVLFEFDIDTEMYTVRIYFNHANGRSPHGALIQSTNGKLYGMSTGGGERGNGTIFEYDIDQHTLTKLFDFSDGFPRDFGTGAFPYGDLLEDENGLLYGMTSYLNNDRKAKGTLFAFDPMKKRIEIRSFFDWSRGAVSPYGNLIKVNGLFYGLTSNDEAAGQGVIFQYCDSCEIDDEGEDHRETIFRFYEADGTFPLGSLTLSSNGKLYGVTKFGGKYNGGTLFELDPVTKTFSKKADFDKENGQNPVYAQLVLVGDQRPQTLAFDAPLVKYYGDQPFVLSGSATSGLPVTFAISDPDIVSLEGNTITLLHPGEVIITASQPGNELFRPVQASRKLIVKKALQSIQIDEIPDVVITEGTVAVSGTATSSLPVLFFSQDPDKAKIEGNMITLLNPGAVSVIANQQGNEFYDRAPAAFQSFCILPEKPSIEIESITEDKITLKSSSTSGNIWYRDGAIMALDGGETYTGDITGVYQVQTKVDYCLSEMSNEFNIIMGVDDDFMSRIQLHPNPATSTLFISGVQHETSFSVFDMTSSKVPVNAERRNDDTTLDVSNLRPGIYIVRISSGRGYVFRKFIRK